MPLEISGAAVAPTAAVPNTPFQFRPAKPSVLFPAHCSALPTSASLVSWLADRLARRSIAHHLLERLLDRCEVGLHVLRCPVDHLVGVADLDEVRVRLGDGVSNVRNPSARTLSHLVLDGLGLRLHEVDSVPNHLWDQNLHREL